MSKVLMLGLDGVGFPMLEPAFDEGHMPRLKALLDGGVAGVLTSTIPPYTPPGWTSIFTGVNPGKHGIFGFTLGNAQHHEGLVRLDRVRAPAVWNALNAQGKRVGLFNIPMTYPPPPVEGWAVSGMLTPESGGMTPQNFTHPAGLARDIAALAPDYQIDIEVDYDVDWRSAAIIDRLSRNLKTKRAALEYLLEKDGDVDVLFAVVEAPDRLMHVHYKYIDPSYEHFAAPEAVGIRARAWEFFDEIDAVVGDLLAWAGDDGYVVTMSDHGFQGKDKGVNVNLALKEWGLLTLRGAGSLAQAARVRRAARRVRNIVPRSIRRRAKAAAHSSIDWSRTKAFSAPIPQQGIYVNLEGREPHGIVARSDYETVRDEVTRRLEGLVDPDDGKPVVDRVYRREEIVEGPIAEHAPDLFPVCRGYAYELSDGLFSAGVLTDYRHLPRGFHHMDGIFGIAGPAITPARADSASLYDIAPTALYLAGCSIPEMDGHVLTQWLPRALVDATPPKVAALDLPLAGAQTEAPAYSADEEAQIEESLRNLGYL